MEFVEARSRELLQLFLAPGTAGLPLLALLDHFGSLKALAAAPDHAWKALNSSLRQVEALRAAASREAGQRLDQALRWSEPAGRWLLAVDHPAYPALLRNIPRPPLFLFVEGRDAGLLQAPQLAIVGARRATSSARRFAAVVARDVAQAGLVVTSGMAYGIDASAHRAALDAGLPTIAVHGCGLDHCYPAAHAGLRQAIAGQGLHVSEFPPWLGPRKHHFPRRNRLISGLALGVLVVEAGERSGSLLTARHALEQGREVFAVPGSVHNPIARGSNNLLRDGAVLVQDAVDILAAIPPVLLPEAGSTAPAERGRPALGDDALRVLVGLEHELQPVDRLLERSGLPVARYMAALTELELAGCLLREAGQIARIEPGRALELPGALV